MPAPAAAYPTADFLDRLGLSTKTMVVAALGPVAGTEIVGIGNTSPVTRFTLERLTYCLGLIFIYFSSAG